MDFFREWILNVGIMGWQNSYDARRFVAVTLWRPIVGGKLTIRKCPMHEQYKLKDRLLFIHRRDLPNRIS